MRPARHRKGNATFSVGLVQRSVFLAYPYPYRASGHPLRRAPHAVRAIPAPLCWRRAHGRGRFSPRWVPAAQLPVLVEAAAVPLWPGSHGNGRKPNTSKIAPPSESLAPGARIPRGTERHHARRLLHPAGATWAGSEPKRPGRHTNVPAKEAAASSARRLEVRREAKVTAHGSPPWLRSCWPHPSRTIGRAGPAACTHLRRWRTLSRGRSAPSQSGRRRKRGPLKTSTLTPGTLLRNLAVRSGLDGGNDPSRFPVVPRGARGARGRGGPF
ncbi:unnamed protein product [Ixodes pacificus]